MIFNQQEFEKIDLEFRRQIGVYERLLNYVENFIRRDWRVIYESVNNDCIGSGITVHSYSFLLPFWYYSKCLP